MIPISPVIAPEFQDIENVYGAHQTEYVPLPAIRRSDGMVLSRWALSTDERAAVAAGADIFLYQLTFSMPLQPMLLEVAESDRTLVDTAIFMGLITVDPCSQCGYPQGSVVVHECAVNNG